MKLQTKIDLCKLTIAYAKLNATRDAWYLKNKGNNKKYPKYLLDLSAQFDKQFEICDTARKADGATSARMDAALKDAEL